MRHPLLTASTLLGLAFIVGCQDNPVALPSSTQPNLALPGPTEVVSQVVITSPSSTTKSIAVGATFQGTAKLLFNLGGVLPGAPYVQWRSTNECVATTTNGVNSSWGLVAGVSAGEAKIIAEFAGKADTVVVTVTGTGNTNPSCAENQWSWNFSDFSFTGKPLKSTQYYVAPGETLIKVVLFAAPKPDYTIPVGGQVTIKSELWYSGGGKISGKGYVSFSSTDPTVATVNAKGVARGLAPGRTKIIGRLGTQFADTVPLYVVPAPTL